MAQPAAPLFSSLHLLHRASQRADDLFARHVRPSDLTPRQFVVLQAVAHKNGLSQTDIMAVTGIDRSTTAALVRTLVTYGWLKRRRTRRDARVYSVRITPSGRQMLDAGLSATRAAEDELLFPISEKQRLVLVDLLVLLESTPRGDDNLAGA
jgi:DNA-binding MarR family transcriptional regulator